MTRKLLVGGGIAACVLGLMWLVPGLVALPYLFLAERSPYCSIVGSVAGIGDKLRRFKDADEIYARTTFVRKDGDLTLWRTPHGNYWVPGDNDRIVPLLLSQQDNAIYGNATNGGVKPGDVVVDCGAHIGTYVRTALAAGASLVVAVEPSPGALAAFERNLAAEILAGKVVLVRKGIWDREDTLEFFLHTESAAGDSFEHENSRTEPSVRVPVTTIDSIVDELKLPRVDLIKADVKGAGTRMVVGASKTIRRFRPRLIVSTEEAPEDPAAVTAAAMRLNPDYRLRCGPCLYTGTEVRTDVLFLR